MNKKLFLGMFAAAGMLLATSCSNDELDVVQSGNEAQVTFSLVADGGITTRAISDGTGAKKLVYAVYNAEGELITKIANADVNGQFVDNSAFDNGLTENVTITLAKGQQYTVAFWAQNPNCTAYTTTDLKNVTVDYAGLNNDETRDAFFKAETFTVTGNAEIDVVLKRPFAQINVGIYQTDWDAAVASGLEIEKSKVTIEKAATSINLLTGEVDGEQTVEYGFDIIPAKFDTPETLDVDLDKDGTKENYVYLSMSYILANDATTGYAKTTLEDLDFTFAPISGNNINFSEGLNAVPVQRNWRTNIIGKILTGDVTFNITIDPIYDGEYKNGDAYGVKANNTYYKTIKDAIDAGATEIELAAGLWKMPSVSNKTLTISGANKDAKIDLSDIVTLSNTSVDFTNVTIVKENENYVGFYHANSLSYTDCVFENEYWGYGGTETFNNCVFNQTSAGNYNVWTYGANATFNDCTFNSAGKAVLVYIEGGDSWRSVVFKNCTFNASAPVEGKSAIEIDSSLAPFEVTIENCTATGFAKGSVSGNILYNLKKGVQGTKGEVGVNCQITLNGDNTYAEGLIVKDGNYFASSNEGIANAISAGATTINLTKGSYVIPSAAKGKTLTIIGTGTPEDVNVTVTKVGTGYENCDYGLDGSTVTFDGITITTNSSTYIGYARCTGTYKNCVINGTYTLYGDSKFENCTFNVSGDVYNIWTWGAKNIEFDRCTFNSDGKALLLYQEGTNTVNLTVKSCIFNDNGGLTSKKAAIEIGDAPYSATPTYNVTVSGTTVNGYEINNEGINTGTTLWGNKNSMPAERLNVTVDGVNVY